MATSIHVVKCNIVHGLLMAKTVKLIGMLQKMHRRVARRLLVKKYWNWNRNCLLILWCCRDTSLDDAHKLASWCIISSQ